MPGSPQEQDQLLRRYRRTRSRETRDRILENYLPLIYTIARRILVSRNVSLDLEDLVGIGSLALLDSLKRYDPKRGVPFSVFAGHRIRGAILDEFRKLGSAKRMNRPHESETGSGAHVAAVAADGSGNAMSGGGRVRDRGFGYESLDLLVDPRGSGSIDDFERREIIDHLTMALNQRERNILNLYYGRGITMREISKRMGLSVPRISALHSSILDRLQARFKEMKNEVFS